MTNEIITTNPSEIRTFNFKSASLNNYANQIENIRMDFAHKNVELAKILGKVKTEKAYAEDGFSSVAEFAEKTFNIAKSNAYSLANAGSRFYNVDGETAQKVAAMLSPYNLAEISSMTDEEIETAISEGKISKDSTQKSLRDLSNSAKEAKSAKVEKAHNIVAFIVTPDATHTVKADFITCAKFDSDYLVAQFGFADIISKKFSGDSKSGVYMVLSSDGSFAKVVYEAPAKPKEGKKSKQRFTKEQLLQMLAEAEDDEAGDTGD